MKKFLQMLYGFIPKKGIGFEKYLVVFCMLIGVQGSAFAQYTFLDVPSGTKFLKEGIVRVNPGDNITLNVPYVSYGTPIKWEYRTKPSEDRILLDSETNSSLTINDIQNDVEYIATYKNPLTNMETSARILIACVSFTSTSELVCPREAVAFDYTGGQFADKGKFEQRKDGPAWHNLKDFQDNSINEWIITEGEKDYSMRVSLDYSYYNTTVATLTTNEINVKLRDDCKATCLTTTTGEYYVGTDFDPNKNDPKKIPQDVINHFGEHNIELREADVKNYWLGNNAREFFGQDPMEDVAKGVVGKNNYMFCQNPNDRICELIFSPVSEFLGKPYTYKMRMYLQKEAGCNIDENAKFKARTGQGKQTIDRLKGAAYLNSTGELLGKADGYDEGDMTLSFKQLMNLSSLNDYDLIKIEIVFEGRFPDSPNGLSEFSFFPEFAQMSCWKVAIDYISAEVEDVCLDPDVLCAGEYTTAHAAGMPDGSVYRWYKKVGDNWIEDDTNYGRQNASIQAEKGLVSYQLRVDIPGLGLRTHDFVVSGNDCSVPIPKINGGTYCLPKVQAYTPSIVDHSKEVTYEWAMFRPDGSLWFDSKTAPDSHFNVLSSHEYADPSSEFYPNNKNKNDSLVISLGLDSAVVEGDYKLQLRTMTGSIAYATIDTIVHVYRNPEISLKLDGEKFAGINSESEKTICPSDMRREIIAIAENAFDSPMLSKYIYNWNSDPGSPNVFIPDSKDPRKATVNLAAIPGICDGDLDKVQFSVQAYIGGCADADTNKYNIEKLVDPTIDCNSLTGKDTFYCESKKESAKVTIPIPDFTSGCDTDPDIIIEFTPKRKEVKDTMGTKNIVVRKSEVENSDLLKVVLPWGTYDFHYTIKDGCGKTISCDHLIVVEKGFPDIPCDEILDLDVINGRDSIESSKCAVKLGVKDIPIPELLDRNSENDTILTGTYSGRLHFEEKQDRDDLKSTAEKRAKFDSSIDLYEEYDIDYTYILWKFTNGDKSSYCVQEVVVRDTGVPSFDCATIDPFEYRPETETCEIEFKDFKNYLYGKKYTAYDSCPEPVTPIPGELHEDSVKISKVDESKVFLVGIADTLYWQFRDRHDNLKYCPQVVNPKSKRSVVIDCKTLEYFEGTAKEGTCFVDAEELNIPNPPYGKEACLGKDGDSIPVPGVGTRSDGKALNDPYPAGDTYITWLFEGKNSAPAICSTHVFVHGVIPPVLDCDLLFPKKWYEMPDCDSMDITLETKKVPDPCVAGFMSEGVPYINGEKIELKHKFPIGETFVTWKFWDYTKSAVDSCVQSIHLRDTFPPDVDCDTLKNDSVILDGKCSILTKDLRDSLTKKVAIEHCTGDTIWGEPYLLDTITGQRREIPEELSVGIYPIQWVFANDSLTTKEATCNKILYLLHDGEPIFDCSTLKSPLQLWDTTGECKIILNQNTLPIPEAVDSCKRDYIVYGHGYVQLFEEGDFVELCYFDRENNKAVYLMDLPLGGHNVKWIFKSPFSVKEKPCVQTVLANSDAINKIDCSKLAEYVHVTMRRQGLGATFEEVRDSGLILPNLDFDVCKVLDTLYTRDDDKSIYADYYPVGNRVTITWLFRDTTPKAEKKKECQTIVDVEDGDTPIMVCPKLDTTFICLDALPARFANFEEFKAAGGELVSNGVDVSEFVDHSSFKCDTMSVGDKCDYTFIRKYSIANLRKQISECEQKIHIKDTIAPVWLDDAASLTKVFDCEAEDFFPTDLKAKDECSNDIFSEYHKVNSLDGVVDGLFYTVSSNKSDNPEDCEYYNYREIRKYVAVDRCRNYSAVLEYVAQVQDTFAPIINMPDTASWRTAFVPAVYAHIGCTFLYPDLTSSFPKDSLKDICDPAASKYFKITQTPAAGTVIQNTKIPQFVTLHITDPCGLEDTLMKEIYVQDPKDIIDVEMKDTTICAEQELTLNDLFKYSGYIYRESWFEEGKWDHVKNENIVYDYYKGDVDEKNLVYSNNKTTYGNRYNQSINPREFIELSSMSDEGKYTIVGMDTSLHCVDTTSAYITVHAAPSIGLNAAPLLVCEKDSIHLISDNETLYEKYKLNVSDNGEEITEEGWMLNGNKYKPETLLDYTDALVRMQYYATNICGIGMSSDWISLSMKRRMSPDNLMLTTEPNNPSRVYLGESAKLNLISKYKPELYMWYRVKGIVDGNSDKMFDKYGNVREDYMGSDFEPDTLLGITNYGEPGSRTMELRELGDSAQYYVLLVDSVCPAVPSNIVAIDVVQKLPTAFTPHNSIGMNDIFMEGHKVVIFNRYGQKMVESDNGWDGTCRGDLVDPGVYFYEVIINDGERHKGSIEVVYFK